MSAPAWMPLYIADYLADTGHLSTVEHGAYLLLIMHYWQNSGLPDDDAKLARICRLPLKQWQGIRSTIAELFADDWRHGRIDAELAKAEDTISKRSAAGRAAAYARHNKRTANAPSNAQQTDTPSPLPSPIEEERETRASGSPIWSDWQPSPATVQWCALKCITDARLAEHVELFIAHYRHAGTPSADWDSAFKKWVIRAPQFDRGRNSDRGKSPSQEQADAARLVFGAFDQFANGPRDQSADPGNPRLLSAAGGSKDP